MSDGAFLEMAEHLPVRGKQCINSLVCFSCVGSFCFPYKNVFISTNEFSIFYSLDSLPNPAGGGQREQHSGRLGSWLGLNHGRREVIKPLYCKIKYDF